MEENRAISELSHVLLRYNEHADHLKRAELELEEEFDEREKVPRGAAFDPELYRMHNRYIERLDSEKRNARSRLDEIRPELEIEQGKVTEARRNRRVVELLKEKRKAEYDHQLKKLERKELEESAILRGQESGRFFAGPGGMDETGAEFGIAERGKPAEDLYAGESELPEEKRDYVEEYFERMGMEHPGKKKR